MTEAERASQISRPHVMAVASAGGHWVQLLRLRPVWEGCRITYVTTDKSFLADLIDDARSNGEPEPGTFAVQEANRWQKLRLLQQVSQIALALLRARPDVIITTGAAPGYFAIRLGKLIGARTIWLDSIANAEEISLSCRKIGRHADLWLTQWPHLAGDGADEPTFLGAVL